MGVIVPVWATPFVSVQPILGVAGIEAGLETILVLTGVTTHGETELFPFRPSRIVESVAELIPEVG